MRIAADEEYVRTDPSPGGLEYKQKRFVNMFACEKFPKCQVKVQIALKILEIVNFFLKFPRVSKNLFDVLNSQKNSGNM